MNLITLYSPDGKRQRRIYHVDAPGWIAQGWSTELVEISNKQVAILEPEITLPEPALKTRSSKAAKQ